MTEYYVVTWSCGFEAESPEDAAEQGWAAIEDAIKQGGSATILTVRETNDDFAGRYDMAYVPPIEMGQHE